MDGSASSNTGLVTSDMEALSGNFYDITSALREGVLYPSLDPSIFEIKYPNSDIRGKVLGDNLGVGE